MADHEPGADGAPHAGRGSPHPRLVNQLVPDAELDATALAFAHELATGPIFAFAIGKKLVRQLRTPSLETYMAVEMWGQTLAVTSEDHQEGARAFREKRKPVFRGA